MACWRVASLKYAAVANSVMADLICNRVAGVVEAHADRLQVLGFASDRTDRAAPLAAEVWDLNGMAAPADEVHRDPPLMMTRMDGPDAGVRSDRYGAWQNGVSCYAGSRAVLDTGRLDRLVLIPADALAGRTWLASTPAPSSTKPGRR